MKCEIPSVQFLTWYLVKSVLHTPVSNIIPTRKGMMARAGIIEVMVVGLALSLSLQLGYTEVDVSGERLVGLRSLKKACKGRNQPADG